jgi:hypothetical protein
VPSQAEDMLMETQANLLAGADQRATDAVQFLGRCDASQLLGECIAFARYNFVEGWPSDMDALSRVGWFPWVVAQHDLNVALYQVLLAMYSSVYDNLRRAIEITLIGALFVSGRAAREESSEWIASKRPTPFFGKALERLLRESRFQALDYQTGWAYKIKTSYWRFADVTHVRGRNHWINRSVLFKEGMSVPAFSAAAAERAAGAYIATVQQLCTILATTNPVLLHGLPLDEKFGLDPPMSGFFNSVQAERLWELLPKDTHLFFSRLLETDPDVAAMIDHVEQMPNLTDAEIELQADRLRGVMNLRRSD